MTDRTALIEQFLEFKRRNRGRALRTVQIYRLALEQLQEYMRGKDLLDADQDDLVGFTGPWLAKRNVLANSRRPYVAAVRQFYQWLFNQQLLDRNPSHGVPYPRTGSKLPRVISLANIERLISAPDLHTFVGVRDCAMIALLAGCGLRVSGLVNLNAGHVLTQKVDGRDRMFIRVREKGDKERLVPVPAEADLQLRVYMEHPMLKTIDRMLPDGDQVLFVSTRNRTASARETRGERLRLTRQSVLKMIAKYGRPLGIPDDQLHPHAMRHLYGTEMAEHDVHLLVQQQLMGHADPKSTQIYTLIAMRKLVREVDRANP
ncbi:MAG: tyrosine-type recombinase/integrase, partial [Burkholderiales bacterium]|nr:tyrosine-type recombinase/integrase [Burkholderiales bacterium]